MGKRNTLREARRHEAAGIISAVLTAHSKRDAPRVATTFDDFPPDYLRRIAAWRALAARLPQDWRPRIKSRDTDRRFLDLVRFSFARYSVAAHLERVWIEEFADDLVDRIAPLARDARGPDLRRWYIVAAQGRSLYREVARPYLSKLEAHHLLTAPVASARRAFWYAFARAQVDDVHLAVRIAQTKLTDFSAASSFWKEVARWFARNPAPLAEMNDLIDYLYAAKFADEAFSLKGRSLAALRRRKEEWHRALRKQAVICGGSWAGLDLPDVAYEAGSEAKRAIWRFRQIKTGNDLYREGQRMHHCVAGYKWLCERGDVSIWSLTSEFPLGHVNRGVTIEVRRSGAIVQCRGFANRLPYPNEVTMVRRWADAHGLTWCAATGLA